MIKSKVVLYFSNLNAFILIKCGLCLFKLQYVSIHLKLIFYISHILTIIAIFKFNNPKI